MAGFSLIELMVAVTLGLLLILAMATLLAQQNKARSELENTSAQVENGRYALSLLQSDIQLAGFYGEFSGPMTAPGTLPNACEVSNVANIDAALALPLQGYDNVGSTIPGTLSACLDAANHLDGTDILVIRRLQAADPAALTSIADAKTSNPKRIYVQTSPLGRVTARGENDTSFTLFKKNGTTPADLRVLVERIYFVSPCNVFASGTTCTAAADGGKPIPTLKRLELSVVGGATAFELTPLVEGVENMQLDYGLNSADNVGAPAYPFIQTLTDAQWPDVVAVNITLLVRNPTETFGLEDTKTYDLGLAGSVGPFNDGYRRHVYSSSVRVVNVSGRKE